MSWIKSVAMRYISLMDDFRSYYLQKENEKSALTRTIVILTVLACFNLNSLVITISMIFFHHINRGIMLGFDHPIAIAMLVASFLLHLMISKYHPYVPQRAGQGSKNMAFRAKAYIIFSAILFLSSIVTVVIVTLLNKH